MGCVWRHVSQWVMKWSTTFFHPTVPSSLRALSLTHAIASSTWSRPGVKEMLRAAVLSWICFWHHAGSSEEESLMCVEEC